MVNRVIKDLKFNNIVYYIKIAFMKSYIFYSRLGIMMKIPRLKAPCIEIGPGDANVVL